MAVHVLIALGIAVLWVLSLIVDPFGKCWLCRGRRVRTRGRRARTCRACHGQGRRQRLGSPYRPPDPPPGRSSLARAPVSRGTWQGSGTWQTTSGGGGGLVLAVIVATLLIGSGAASAIASAVVTIAIVTASLAVLAVLGGVALLVYRTRQDRPGAVFTARPVPPAPPDQRPALSSGHKQAIEPPREVHLHLNVSPDQLAAIMRHHLEEE